MNKEKNSSEQAESSDPYQGDGEESNVPTSQASAAELPQGVASPSRHASQQRVAPNFEVLMQNLSRAHSDAKTALGIAYGDSNSDCTPAAPEGFYRSDLTFPPRSDFSLEQTPVSSDSIAVAALTAAAEAAEAAAVVEHRSRQATFESSLAEPVQRPSRKRLLRQSSASTTTPQSQKTVDKWSNLSALSSGTTSQNYPALNVSVQVTKRRKYRHESFPRKLHRMIKEAEQAGKSDIISWTPCGKAFEIHKWEEFENELIPNYFRHKRMSSFRRQMSMYGFRRVVVDNGFGGFAHEDFHRDHPEQSYSIRRASEVHYKVLPSSAQKDSDE